MRKIAAYTLYCLAAMLALLAVCAIAYDLIYPPGSAGNQAAQLGFTVGVVIGIALRTVVLVFLSLGALSLGLGINNPNKWSADTISKSRLAKIAEEYQTRALGEQPPGAIEFMQRTNAELEDIYSNIDRKTHSDRFDGLIWVICKRAEDAT